MSHNSSVLKNLEVAVMKSPGGSTDLVIAGDDQSKREATNRKRSTIVETNVHTMGYLPPRVKTPGTNEQVIKTAEYIGRPG